MRWRIALFLPLAALVLGACGEAPPPRLYGLEKVDAPAPREFQFEGALENRKSEPYAPLMQLSSVAVLPDGRMFLADIGSGRIHRFDKDGEYLGAVDRPSVGFAPLDLAALSFHLYALDRSEQKVYRFNRDGVLRDMVLDLNALDLDRPVRISAFDFDRDGRLALADAVGHRVLVTSPFLKFDYSVGEYGQFLGQLNQPDGVCFGPSGFLYVSDKGNARVEVFDETGQVLAATPGLEAVHPLMVAPAGLDTDRFGNVYVADAGMGVVHVLAPDLHYLSSVGGDEFAPDHLRTPVDCAVGPDDRLYVIDAGRNALLVYRIVFP
ncbi:MAG TPA: NHL repeat-containing protein [Candidatus Krumholzibacteria bacterium]|nr:NHL repeat-containing protein [Candidatus Krumholzibacteria bacterium]